ncbi:50S ribosomal protein L2 [Candidatus Woesearchaeota archaeon]|nr:50S ribosomal protein L2 [Candidatus Woesearchaeota archaeon]
MGKTLIQQARGKGGPRYRAPSFNYAGRIKFNTPNNQLQKGTITDIISCPGHNAPLIQIEYEKGETIFISAPEEVKVGDQVTSGQGGEVKTGNILTLKEIPEGIPIFNVESQPGDGGKLCRSPGTCARIVAKAENHIIIKLPSKKEKSLNINCRAVVGMIAAGGIKEKPFLKAGRKHHAMKARNRLYPRTTACAMNAVDHPFGNKRSSRKAHQIATTHDAPPGRKVGKISPRRTGRKK